MRSRVVASALVTALALATLVGPAEAHAFERPEPAKPRQPRQPRTPEMVRSSGGDGGRPSLPARREPAPTPTAKDVPELATPVHGEGSGERSSALPENPRETADPPPSSIPDRIAAAWPGDDAKALRVTGCESDHVPTAVGAVAEDGSRYQGLWQFDRQTYRSVGGSWPAVNDSVEEQTRRAWDLKRRRGWQPWPTCGSA